MNDASAQRLYSVVLVAGSMRSHESDWAGLCVAARGRKLVVKPLAIRVAEAARAEATFRPSEKTTTLRIARECPMKTLDISTVMERLTFAPDGVGRVRGDHRSDAPPMLRERFRVDLNSAERAMVAGKSPEEMRGDGEKREGNYVSETVHYSRSRARPYRSSRLRRSNRSLPSIKRISLSLRRPRTRANALTIRRRRRKRFSAMNYPNKCTDRKPLSKRRNRHFKRCPRRRPSNGVD